MTEPNPYPPCPTSPDLKHWPHWRDWRSAEREGREVACERCDVTIWPVCSTCGLPRIGWAVHDFAFHDSLRAHGREAVGE